MNFIPREKLALSIGGGILRALLFQGAKVTRWVNLPIRPDLLHKGAVADLQGLAGIIRRTLRERGIKAKKVLLALPSADVLWRLITLPSGRDIVPREVIPREVRRLLGISLEENYLFWARLPGPSAEQRFFALVVPRAMLYSWLETLKLAGLKPARVELSSLCLARSVNEGTAIILQAEPTSIEVIILKESVPQLMRSLFLTEETLLPGTAAGRVTQELERNLSFYSSSHREEPLPPDTPVFLCGSLSADPELAPAIEATTGFRVKEIKPVVRVPQDLPLAQFMVNLGLIMGEL